MKKILSLLMCFIFVFSLTGCSFDSAFEKYGTPTDWWEDVKSTFNSINFGGVEYTEITYEEFYVFDSQFNSCYNALNAKQRDIYETIYKISELMPEGYISIGEYYDQIQTDLSIAYTAFLYDRAEIFWMPNSYIFATSQDGNKYIATVSFNTSYGDDSVAYLCTKSERDKYKAELEEKIDYIMSLTNSIADQYEIEKILNDYLCQNIQYVDEGVFVHTAFGALIQGEALCEGYSKAFKLLCNSADIECDIVIGSADGIGHMWNTVNIDGKHSFVDVTWNDRSEYLIYTYFNFTTEQMKLDHNPAPLYKELSEQELLTENYNFIIRNATFSGNSYYERNNYVLSGDFMQNITKKIIERRNNGIYYIDFLFNSDYILSEFNRDNEAFIANIQKNLKNIFINSYSLERDVLILTFEDI